ncbi:PEGA domain-containing protein [Candidatus Poribacteria bacterium]|nr:PEGA domain-containing protein [Candidatus Poribacteria bacterium]
MRKSILILILLVILGIGGAFIYYRYLSGLLIVTSFPNEAIVDVDDKTRGETPLFERLIIGKHKVEVYKRGYGRVRREIKLKARQELKLVLKLPVMINSNPSGADLYIDDRYIGKTPQAVDLKPGIHKFKLHKDGFLDYNSSLMIAGEYLKPIPPINLKPIPPKYKIPVTSTPPKAKVYLDDRYQGETPITLELKAGRYLVEIMLNGYEPYRDLLLVPYKKRIDVKLKRIIRYGSISVNAFPYGRVFLDGIEKGETPILIRRVPEGEHTVTIKRDGFKEIIRRVIVRHGKRVKIGIKGDNWVAR